MKNECSLVRDMLPLYLENMVSEETRAFIKEHLETCPECAAAPAPPAFRAAFAAYTIRK